MEEHVPESSVDYAAIIRRGGANFGDEDFAFFKCPACARVYLIDYEVDTVYLDPTNLAHRTPVAGTYFDCVGCGQTVPSEEPWVGPNAGERFQVTWYELDSGGWAWAARRE
jgi:hypothetical protein